MKASGPDLDISTVIPYALGGIAPVLLPVKAGAAVDRQNTLDAPLNYFLHSFGPASRPTMRLGWIMTGLLSAITFLVALLLITTIWRKRSPADQQAIGQEKGGLRWVYIGTGLSTCILAGLAVYSPLVLNAVAKPSQAPILTLNITGYDWWWKIEYASADTAYRFITANEIHIPVGEPVLLQLNSADVIHAF